MSTPRFLLARAFIAAITLFGTATACSDTTPDGPSSPDQVEPETDTERAGSSAFPVVIDHAMGATEIPAEPMVVVSASATMTGHLLAIDVPIAAAQVLPPQSPLADENGFMLQWGAEAASAGVQAIAGPEVNVEAIAAVGPDLIVGNAFGGDAITEDVYALLSEIAPTLVIDHSGMEWQELSEILSRATGRQDQAAGKIAAFDAHIAELAAAINSPYPVVAGVVTAEGINVFTAESSHGKLLTALGLDIVEIDGSSLDGEQGAGTRADVVSVSPELVPDLFGDATILFVFGTQSDIDQALDLYPTLGAIPAATEGRLVPLGPESFRLDPYSAVLTAQRLAEALR